MRVPISAPVGLVVLAAPNSLIRPRLSTSTYVRAVSDDIRAANSLEPPDDFPIRQGRHVNKEDIVNV